MRNNFINIFILCICLFQNPIAAYNQYFGGRNKPAYKVFAYKVFKTPHYEIYHYNQNDSSLENIAGLAEKWYLRHQVLFKDTFKKPNPLIIYNNHPDFQQTSAISGTIGAGTGGVTEALKNRVVMPVMESQAQTDHVMGHELVHAFQYRILLSDDSTGLRSLRNMPLWMVEGMAEYLSIGSYDPFTSMWMRDALLSNKFPTLDEMSKSYEFFPYRYGQAFWAFMTGLYGDTIIRSLFELTTRVGYEKAIEMTTPFNERNFSSAWEQAMRNHYFKYMPDTVDKPFGNKIIDEYNAGENNIVPSLSPDGKKLIFISEKDLFTYDLFIADAQTGKNIKKLSSTVHHNTIDDYNFLESGGTWSPDGRKFAIVVFKGGRNQLLLIDIKRKRNTKNIIIPGLESFSNPTWSPDGNSIVVSGLKDAKTDLYQYNLIEKSTKRLTNNPYCHLQPSWSPDGRYIVFATDKTENATKPGGLGYSIGLYDIEKDSINYLNIFKGASNLNPHFSPDGRSVYFLSDVDGFRNLYRHSLDSSVTYRMTQILTGICGITSFTPAFTIDRNDGKIVYTHYTNSKFNLYQALAKDFPQEKISIDAAFTEKALAVASLPPSIRLSTNIVDPSFSFEPSKKDVQVDSFKIIPYKPKFKLDYIGSSGMGVSVNSYYGTGMAGSVDMLFSDIVGNNTMYTSLSLNGEIYDFGGMLAYINSKYLINFGASLSHIPYINYNYTLLSDSIPDFGNVTNYALDMYRIFEDQASIFAIYPFSSTQRVELGTSLAHYSYRVDRYNNYYKNGYSIGQGNYKDRLPSPPGFFLHNLNLAYTLDNSFFGIASPLRGQRFRIESEQYFGKVMLSSLLVDYRKYVYVKPIAFAFRLYNVNRFGPNEINNFVYPFYLGYPWLIRGFDNAFVLKTQNFDQITQNEKLLGSRMAISNFEIRLPFTGPKRLSLISSKYLFTELSIFADAGVTWKKNILPQVATNNSNNDILIVTSGISLRINVLGAMILEPYYAMPFKSKGWEQAAFGLNFMPGW